MALKELCTTLQQCAKKLEEDIKYNINDIHNLVYSNKLNETKMALEKAKDYHYKEIMDSIGEILKNIRKILFHQDKIEWLSDENNFTKDELRRFSYVKRQVFVFSNSEEIAAPSSTPSIRKEKRRTASQVSVGTLEDWEKYVDQKNKEEKQVEEKVAELKPLIPKRTLSNARRRKKFVSSTLGGFLEADEGKINLDSIAEDTSSIGENDRVSFSQSLESLDKMISSYEKNVDTNKIPSKLKTNDNISPDVCIPKTNKQVSFAGSLKSFNNMSYDNEISGGTDICQNDKTDVEKKAEIKNKEENGLSEGLLENSEKLTTGVKINSDVINIIDDSIPKDDNTIINEIMSTFLDDTDMLPGSIAVKDNLIGPNLEMVKPKIVDVIYKKKPS